MSSCRKSTPTTEHAKAAGAEIVLEIQDAYYGGRLYFALDP